MDSERFQEAIARIDAANAGDPQGEALPYSHKLTAWVAQLAPAASEPLRLAARAQHICRWLSPRDSYPAGRIGYLKWREDLKQFHAKKAGEILQEVGYDQATIARVQDLICKRNFPRDAEGRVLEDALCLTFLESQFAATAAKAGDDKMVEILRKTWRKMTPTAQTLAGKLPLTAAQRALLEQALAPQTS